MILMRKKLLYINILSHSFLEKNSDSQEFQSSFWHSQYHKRISGSVFHNPDSRGSIIMPVHGGFTRKPKLLCLRKINEGGLIMKPHHLKGLKP
jgi:hypothetical protein